MRKCIIKAENISAKDEEVLHRVALLPSERYIFVSSETWAKKDLWFGNGRFYFYDDENAQGRVCFLVFDLRYY